jgi:hypothetical protein
MAKPMAGINETSDNIRQPWTAHVGVRPILSLSMYIRCSSFFLASSIAYGENYSMAVGFVERGGSPERSDAS